MFYRCVDYERKGVKDVVSYGLASGVGETLNLPLNIVKVRLQLHGEHLGNGCGKPWIRQFNYTGTVDGLRKLISREPHGQMLSMIYARLIVNSGLSLLMHHPVKKMYHNLFQQINYSCDSRDSCVQIPTILTNCALTVLAYQPMTVVKVRIQSARYFSAITNRQMITKIYHEDGIRGFWRATVPSYTRTAIYMVVDFTFYNKLEKKVQVSLGLGQISAKMISNIVMNAVYVVLTNPIDVMRIRQIHATPKYRGYLQFVQWTLKHEGFMAFYKGSAAAYGSMLIWDLSLLLLHERIKSIMNHVV